MADVWNTEGDITKIGLRMGFEYDCTQWQSLENTALRLVILLACILLLWKAADCLMGLMC